MMKKIIYLFLFIGLFVPYFTFASENDLTLALSPIIMEVKVDPGSSQIQKIGVNNKSSKAQGIRVYAQNFFASDEFGGVTFDNSSSSSYTAKDWLNFQKNNLVLAPKEQENLVFTIQAPKKAEPGGHYAVVFFEPIESPELSQNSSLGVTGRVGALLFITVSGQILEKGRVLGASSSDKCSGVSCSFKTKRFREWGPVPFEFRFENTGNIHVKVKGKIEIYNIFRQKIAEIPVDEKTVLPKSIRYFEAKWLREPLFGRYTAKLAITYGSLRVTDQAQTSFWAIPWKILSGFAILGLIFTFFVRQKRKKRAHLNKNGIQKPKKRVKVRKST
jgi:hypothetical protein